MLTSCFQKVAETVCECASEIEKMDVIPSSLSEWLIVSVLLVLFIAVCVAISDNF